MSDLRQLSDMMSGDSSTLPLPGGELKVDVNSYTPNSSLFANNKHVYNEDTAAVLVDMKLNKDLAIQTDPTTLPNNQLDNNVDEQTDTNEGVGDEMKTIPLVDDSPTEEVDAIYKRNSVQKINEDDGQEKEECVVKCLYYAIQCCECTIQ
ncbi:uncharacterized protein LOC123295389 isoform X2 [Chrysoperla carnea]|uniref:uncharacterized protein LOC123295389 isoform X2 n=1 Tax=Chrysoperla carnea TaxID=189513 RepID=UPI001D061BAF|nr:uncharacterized protein LOC123295389 isoform X2 [Chrysoperla carnea]